MPGRPWSKRLAANLIPTVNSLREMAEGFGTISYEVWLVWLRWSGSTRGEGQPSIEREVRITPTPHVASPSAVKYRYEPAGMVRAGDMILDRIPLPKPGTEDHPTSPTSDLLTGVKPYLDRRLPANVQFVWELRGVQKGTQTLRFGIAGEPWHDGARFQWVMALKHIDPDTSRDGITRDTGAVY